MRSVAATGFPPVCVLCRALDPTVLAQPLYNMKLFESDHFVLLPALGPLVTGHVLAVGKRHTVSLATMTQLELADYDSMVQRVARRYQTPDLLEGEHGPIGVASAGSCIDHVHVNLLPGFGTYVGIFDSILPILRATRVLWDLAVVNEPYIMLRCSQVMRAHVAHNVPSQLIRRRLCEAVGRDDWDWNLFPHLDIVRATVDLWSHARPR